MVCCSGSVAMVVPSDRCVVEANSGGLTCMKPFMLTVSKSVQVHEPCQKKQFVNHRRSGCQGQVAVQSHTAPAEDKSAFRSLLVYYFLKIEEYTSTF